MGAFKTLLKRWGYAKLDDYGLVLSPEGRVLATRPAILDDGDGTPIVGYRDGDLAALELERWGSGPHERPTVPALRPPQPTPVPKVIVDAPVRPIRATPPPIPPAAMAKVDEDEWEWEIAMARARAAADEVTAAKRSWMTEEPLADKKWCEDTPIRSVSKLAHLERLVSQTTPSDGDITKQTVIPVPKIPSIANASLVKPVVRASVPPPRRFPRGTNQRLAEDGPLRDSSTVTLQLPVVGRHPARRSSR